MRDTIEQHIVHEDVKRKLLKYVDEAEFLAYLMARFFANDECPSCSLVGGQHYDFCAVAHLYPDMPGMVIVESNNADN